MAVNTAAVPLNDGFHSALNETIQLQEYEVPYVPLAWMIVVLSVSIVGNTFVIASFFRDARLKVIFNLFVVHLATADIVISVIVILALVDELTQISLLGTWTSLCQLCAVFANAVPVEQLILVHIMCHDRHKALQCGMSYARNSFHWHIQKLILFLTWVITLVGSFLMTDLMSSVKLFGYGSCKFPGRTLYMSYTSFLHFAMLVSLAVAVVFITWEFRKQRRSPRFERLSIELEDNSPFLQTCRASAGRHQNKPSLQSLIPRSPLQVFRNFVSFPSPELDRPTCLPNTGLSSVAETGEGILKTDTRPPQIPHVKDLSILDEFPACSYSEFSCEALMCSSHCAESSGFHERFPGVDEDLMSVGDLYKDNEHKHGERDMMGKLNLDRFQHKLALFCTDTTFHGDGCSYDPAQGSAQDTKLYGINDDCVHKLVPVHAESQYQNSGGAYPIESVSAKGEPLAIKSSVSKEKYEHCKGNQEAEGIFESCEDTNERVFGESLEDLLPVSISLSDDDELGDIPQLHLRPRTDSLYTLRSGLSVSEESLSKTLDELIDVSSQSEVSVSSGMSEMGLKLRKEKRNENRLFTIGDEEEELSESKTVCDSKTVSGFFSRTIHPSTLPDCVPPALINCLDVSSNPANINRLGSSFSTVQELILENGHPNTEEHQSAGQGLSSREDPACLPGILTVKVASDCNSVGNQELSEMPVVESEPHCSLTTGDNNVDTQLHSLIDENTTRNEFHLQLPEQILQISHRVKIEQESAHTLEELECCGTDQDKNNHQVEIDEDKNNHQDETDEDKNNHQDETEEDKNNHQDETDEDKNNHQDETDEDKNNHQDETDEDKNNHQDETDEDKNNHQDETDEDKNNHQEETDQEKKNNQDENNSAGKRKVTDKYLKSCSLEKQQNNTSCTAAYPVSGDNIYTPTAIMNNREQSLLPGKTRQLKNEQCVSIHSTSTDCTKIHTSDKNDHVKFHGRNSKDKHNSTPKHNISYVRGKSVKDSKLYVESRTYNMNYFDVFSAGSSEYVNVEHSQRDIEIAVESWMQFYGISSRGQSHRYECEMDQDRKLHERGRFPQQCKNFIPQPGHSLMCNSLVRARQLWLDFYGIEMVEKKVPAVSLQPNGHLLTVPIEVHAAYSDSCDGSVVGEQLETHLERNSLKQGLLFDPAQVDEAKTGKRLKRVINYKNERPSLCEVSTGVSSHVCVTKLQEIPESFKQNSGALANLQTNAENESLHKSLSEFSYQRAGHHIGRPCSAADNLQRNIGDESLHKSLSDFSYQRADHHKGRPGGTADNLQRNIGDESLHKSLLDFSYQRAGYHKGRPGGAAANLHRNTGDESLRKSLSDFGNQEIACNKHRLDGTTLHKESCQILQPSNFVNQAKVNNDLPSHRHTTIYTTLEDGLDVNEHSLSPKNTEMSLNPDFKCSPAISLNKNNTVKSAEEASFLENTTSKPTDVQAPAFSCVFSLENEAGCFECYSRELEDEVEENARVDDISGKDIAIAEDNCSLDELKKSSKQMNFVNICNKHYEDQVSFAEPNLVDISRSSTCKNYCLLETASAQDKKPGEINYHFIKSTPRDSYVIGKNGQEAREDHSPGQAANVTETAVTTYQILESLSITCRALLAELGIYQDILEGVIPLDKEVVSQKEMKWRTPCPDCERRRQEKLRKVSGTAAQVSGASSAGDTGAGRTGDIGWIALTDTQANNSSGLHHPTSERRSALESEGSSQGMDMFQDLEDPDVTMTSGSTPRTYFFIRMLRRLPSLVLAMIRKCSIEELKGRDPELCILLSLICIVMLQLICWLPIVVLYMVYDVTQFPPTASCMELVFLLLWSSRMAIQPVLYAFYSKYFHQNYIEIIVCRNCR